jgi:transcriptional regulator with XRE-family HTH domain
MAKDALKFVESFTGPMTVGILFSAHRTGWDMTQKDLAKKLGVTVGFISNIETGKKRLTLETLLSYCRKLDESEKYWSIVYFKEEARRAGLEISNITFEEKKKKRA